MRRTRLAGVMRGSSWACLTGSKVVSLPGLPSISSFPFGGRCPHRLDDGADLAAQLRAQRTRFTDCLTQRGCLLESSGQRVVRLDPCGFGKRMVEIVAGRTVGRELCGEHGRDQCGGLLAAEDDRADPC